MSVKVVSIKLREDILELLDRYAQRAGLSRSEVIRNAIITTLQSTPITDLAITRENSHNLKLKKKHIIITI